MTFDVNYFIEALERLSFKMIQANVDEDLNIYIIGGFCMKLHGLREATIDIDAYIQEYSETSLKLLINEVGDEIGNPEWLNDDITNIDTIPKLLDLLLVKNSFKLERKIGKINIYVAELETVLITKLLAVMDERDEYQKDVQDVLSIVSRTGFSEQLVIKLKAFAICDFDVLSTLLNVLAEHRYLNETELLKYYEIIGEE